MTTTIPRRTAIPAGWRVCQDSQKCLLLVRYGHRFGDPEVLIDRRMKLLTVRRGEEMVFAWATDDGEDAAVEMMLEWLRWNDDVAF